jgi:hypothetical protein
VYLWGEYSELYEETDVFGYKLNHFVAENMVAGADPGFQVRGGAHKKIAPSGGRHENCWGISCEKSRFYAKKSIFFPIIGGVPPRL